MSEIAKFFCFVFFTFYVAECYYHFVMANNVQNVWVLSILSCPTYIWIGLKYISHKKVKNQQKLNSTKMIHLIRKVIFHPQEKNNSTQMLSVMHTGTITGWQGNSVILVCKIGQSILRSTQFTLRWGITVYFIMIPGYFIMIPSSLSPGCLHINISHE